ncbi:COX15/CtaA family protein [Aurantibacter sp.]|uniref:COX15/CtaA family protein n=1 Tax=Aurantibacter sp. TaxID=2807103 RepID=UPI00326356E0
MKENFRKTAKITLILVYLVIIAGAVVRMTGSGMGCPDWPKCFGHYIPPTDISELQWQPEIDIKKGQIIIVDETLKVSKEAFTTNGSYDDNNWSPYTKHEYAEFNATHTWIEYINRLCGALAGLGTFILAILSFGFWKSNKSITLISWLTVFAMGFQGWLGATVVYSVLEPAKITIHMIMALVIVALLIYLVYKSKEKSVADLYTNKLSTLLGIALLLTLIQIALGTQVRQFVDEQIDLVGYAAKNLWLQNATIQFYIHRTFSVIVVLLNVFILFRIRKANLGFHKMNWVIYLIVLEIFSGILMYYMDFPFSTQAIHLVLASILFGIQYYLLLGALNAKKSNKTL